MYFCLKLGVSKHQIRKVTSNLFRSKNINRSGLRVWDSVVNTKRFRKGHAWTPCNKDDNKCNLRCKKQTNLA